MGEIGQALLPPTPQLSLIEGRFGSRLIRMTDHLTSLKTSKSNSFLYPENKMVFETCFGFNMINRLSLIVPGAKGSTLSVCRN